jgi:hypothetical protein
MGKHAPRTEQSMDFALLSTTNCIEKMQAIGENHLKKLVHQDSHTTII